MSARDLIGSGGGGKDGGGSARTPVEAPDSLRSRDFARVIDLISEGEIVGLVDGLKSVYLNEVPVQDASGNSNFTNLVMDSRTGSQSQSYIPGFPAVENEVQVGAEVKFAVPLVRSIVSASINAVCVRISFPNLSEQSMTNGDTNGTSVQIAIDVQAGSGPWVERVNQIITGKATAKYVRQWRVELTGAGPWQVRVRRLTADSASSSLQNKTFWESYTEVIDAKLRYPNSALVALSVDSSQFNSIPSRAYHMRGLIIQVPSNYDPATRVYSGIWDGRFKPAYSNNPAWVFYDLVLSNRYGLGQFIKAANIDKWSLYAIARYCDELVPTGFGGMEPRFTCNLYLQTRQDAYRVLQDLASVFRGITFWAAGKLTASQDAPDDAEAVFTNANVIDGRFEYQGAAASSRHTVALVTWNDPDNFYRPQIEYVPDDDGISRFGIRQAEISAIGCTSRGQAHRLGRWMLYSEAMESEVVSFKCGLDGVFIMPGSVVKVSDRLRNSKRAGGRIVSATANQVTVDAYQALGGIERLTVVQPDGTLAVSVVLGVVGNVLTLQTPLPFVPVPQSVWVLASDTVPEVFYRVISIAEGEPGQIAVTAVLHSPDKYARIEQNLKLEPVKRPPVAVVPPPPAAIQFTELLQNDAEKITVKLLLGWDSVQGAREYRVRWRFSAGNWSEFNTSDAAYEIRNVPVGLVEVEVGSVGAMGVSARFTAASYTMLGDSAPPVLVSGLVLAEPFAGTGLRAKWNRVPRATGYTVELRTDAGALIRQLFIGDVTHFEYLAESMRADGGPWRSVTLKVRAENTRAQPGPWASLLATNPVPAALSGLLMTAGYDAVRFSCAPPADLDFAGLKVWASGKSGFSVADDTFLVYDGPDIQVPITTLRDGTPLAGGVPVYVRAAAYDAFGKTGLNVSSELSCVPLKVLAGLKPGEISSDLIKAIDAAKIAGELQDVQVEGLAALKAAAAATDVTLGAQVARLDKAVFDASTAAASSSANLSAKIAAGQSGNLLINADFLLSNGNAPAAWQWTGDLPVVRSGSNIAGFCVTPTNTAATWYLEQIGGGGFSHMLKQVVSAEAGKTYAFSVYSGSYQSACWIQLSFLNAAGVNVGGYVSTPDQYNRGEKSGSNTLAGFKRLCLIGKAPADAVQVEVNIGKHATNAGQASSCHFFTRPMLKVVPADATGPTEWQSGQTDVSAIGNAATKADLTAQVARLDSVVIDVAGKASASSVQNIATQVGNSATKADLQAQIGRIDSVASDVAGKASASSVQAVAATVGAQSASITQLSQAQAATDGKLMAKWAVVLNGETADGRKKLSGMQAFNDGAYSNFVITADQVLIGDLSNLVSDPNYMDMAWWGRPNNPVNVGAALDWAKTTRRLILNTSTNGESMSKSFPVTPGGVYRLEVIVYNNHAVGSLKVHLHIPGVRYAGFDGSYSDTVTLSGDGSQSGPATFTTELTFPADGVYSTSNIRIVSSVSAGSFEIGLVSVVRASDSVLIANGAVTADKIKVNTLQAVTARTGKLIVDRDGSICSGGYLNAWAWPAPGTTGFYLSGQGLLMGNPSYANGAFFQYDVTSGYLILNKGTISAATINAPVINGGEINGSKINVKSAESGQRTEITNSLITVFDANGVARVKLGIF